MHAPHANETHLRNWRGIISYNEEQLSQMLAFFKSSAGKKFLAAENRIGVELTIEEMDFHPDQFVIGHRLDALITSLRPK